MTSLQADLDHALIAAWREAAGDLGIDLTAPYPSTNDLGEQSWAEGFLPDFGGAHGMIFTRLDSTVIAPGRYLSRIGATYRHYDRAAFIEALMDWGWFGDEARRPDWLET